jgi:flagellar hook-basal body complex protein FliE
MSIKDLTSFQKTLGTNDTRDWTSKVGKGFELETPGMPGVGGADKETKTFGEFLNDSIGKVNQMQVEANVAMEKLASGESQNLHETLLAVEKAEIAFKTMNQIRSKVIDAYREIMKMQI